MSTSPASVGLSEERLRRLLEVGRSLVAELDLESVLGQVLATARELTGARYEALGVGRVGVHYDDRLRRVPDDRVGDAAEQR